MRSPPVSFVLSCVLSIFSLDSFVNALVERLRREFVARFEIIKGFCAISSKTGKGLDELEAKVLETVQAKNLVKQTIPSTYLMLINALRNQETIATYYQAPNGMCPLCRISVLIDSIHRGILLAAEVRRHRAKVQRGVRRGESAQLLARARLRYVLWQG
jgi:hypothetical protein